MGAEKLEKKSKPKKVLAVDDEEEILKLYGVFLKNQGYDVQLAANAEKCMAAIKKSTPDIILLDVNMPDIDGLRLLEMIRATYDTRSTPIIMISARRDEKTILRAGELGCDNFVIKPFDLKELAKRIATELVEVDLEFVKDAVKRLRVLKNGLLRMPVLSEFDGPNWDCYPFTNDGFEYCFLVPRGLRPLALHKATEEYLRHKIKVFYKHTLRWRQIWP